MRSVSAAPAVDAAKVPSRAMAITIRPRRAMIGGRERRRGPLEGDVIQNLQGDGCWSGGIIRRIGWVTQFCRSAGWRGKFFMGAIARNSVLGTRGGSHR